MCLIGERFVQRFSRRCTAGAPRPLYAAPEAERSAATSVTLEVMMTTGTSVDREFASLETCLQFISDTYGNTFAKNEVRWPVVV